MMPREAYRLHWILVAEHVCYRWLGGWKMWVESRSSAFLAVLGGYGAQAPRGGIEIERTAKGKVGRGAKAGRAPPAMTAGRRDNGSRDVPCTFA